jgi:3-dehydroquinate synthase
MRNQALNFKISSAQGDYPVEFYESVIDLSSEKTWPSDCYFLVDRNVWELYKSKLDFIQAEKTLILDAHEKVKTMQGVTDVIEWLNQKGATKSSLVVGIGGGIIQDISTFVSHVYYRGIKWIYVPTTLLSQSDSCIGAKCGINVLSNKNQVGVLHSPSKVLIVQEFLQTLDRVDYESGYGEIFKLSVTGPNQFFSTLEEHLVKHGLEHSKALPIIAQSLNAKKAIIEIDEYEQDLRRILNYGHSFGHSLESLTENRISHGYAVLFGMDLINFLGVEWGITSADFAMEFRKLISSHFPSLQIERVDSHRLVEGLKKDKKTLHGKINFAVVKEVGNIVIVEREINKDLESLVEKYLSGASNIFAS